MARELYRWPSPWRPILKPCQFADRGLSARPAGPSPPTTQPIAELAGNLPVGVPLGDCLPLVKGPPTARQGDLHLHAVMPSPPIRGDEACGLYPWSR
jgi:hypothetical protein